MRAGSLRNRVTWQRAGLSRDEYGAELVTWGTLATLWAEAEALSGRELLAARQLQAEVTTRFRLRHVAGLKPKDRLVLDGSIYEVEAILPAHDRRNPVEVLARAVEVPT